MVSKERADQIAGGVFLVGLGLLFTNVISFWPGILFVIGAAAIARGMAEGQDWYNVPGGLSMIALGVVFTLNFSWPVILIVIGAAMLFGYNFKSRGCWGGSRRERRWRDLDEDAVESDKPKNEDKLKNDRKTEYL
jgi:hypothetical protein